MAKNSKRNAENSVHVKTTDNGTTVITSQTPNNETENTLMDQQIHNSETTETTETPIGWDKIDGGMEHAETAKPLTFGEMLANRFMSVHTVRKLPKRGKSGGTSSPAKSKRQLPTVDATKTAWRVTIPVMGDNADFDTDWQIGADQTMLLADYAEQYNEIGMVLDSTRPLSIAIAMPTDSLPTDYLRMVMLVSNHRTALTAFSGRQLVDCRHLVDDDKLTLAAIADVLGNDGLLVVGPGVSMFNFTPTMNPLDIVSFLQLCLGIVQKSFERPALGGHASGGWDTDPDFRASKHIGNPSYVPRHDDGNCRQSTKRLFDRLYWNQPKKQPAGILSPDYFGIVRKQLTALASEIDGVKPCADTETTE